MSKPWTVPGAPWKTESAFYGWVRGQLRKGWSRHPIKNLLIQNNRFKKDNGKGRHTWHLECSICKQDTPQTKIQVDHITPAGSLNSVDDIGPFIERLYFVTFDSLRIVCIPCHAIITHQERRGFTTFLEAMIDKRVIEIMRLSSSKVKAFLQNYGVEYITPKEANRSAVRFLIMGIYTSD